MPSAMPGLEWGMAYGRMAWRGVQGRMPSAMPGLEWGMAYGRMAWRNVQGRMPSAMGGWSGEWSGAQDKYEGR